MSKDGSCKWTFIATCDSLVTRQEETVDTDTDAAISPSLPSALSEQMMGEVDIWKHQKSAKQCIFILYSTLTGKNTH